MNRVACARCHGTQRLIDRAVGAIVASAAGDAMGAPYEFGQPNPNAPCELEGGGGFGWAPGEWTDDTQMALAVLATLADGSTDVAAIGQAMVAWYESRPRDVGNQTRAVLGAASRSGIGAADAAAAYQRTNPDSAGNGALMRTGPVALGHLGDREAVAGLAAEVSALTHPHADSVDACVLWSLAIEKAITTCGPRRRFRLVYRRWSRASNSSIPIVGTYGVSGWMRPGIVTRSTTTRTTDGWLLLSRQHSPPSTRHR